MFCICDHIIQRPISLINSFAVYLIASSECIVGSNPVENNLSTSSDVLGTSPAHPLSPPVYSIETFCNPLSSTTISAILLTEHVSPVPKL